MIKFVQATIFLGFYATTALAQEMSYSGQGYTGGTSVMEGSGSYQKRSRTFLDSELDNLPSDVTLEKWASGHRDFFEKYDVDMDGVWSEMDLVEVDEGALKEWASTTVADVFTFWHPDRNGHMKAIEHEVSQISARNDFLAATKGADKSVSDALSAIGLLGNTSAPMYVQAVAHDNPAIERTGRVAEGSRSWFEVAVPFTLKMVNGANENEATYVAHVIAMSRFPAYEGDARWALWNLTISSE